MNKEEFEKLFADAAEKNGVASAARLHNFAPNLEGMMIELRNKLNTLPTEQPSKDLEEEINDYFERHFEICNDNTLKCGGEEFGTYELLDVIEHFTHWQKEQTIKKAYNWLNDNFYQYGEDGIDNNGCSILYDLKNAMEKEDEQ